MIPCIFPEGRRRSVLELGNYIVPAYAGMMLAEQGYPVTKWTQGQDPILGLRRGDELWTWINHRKRLESRHARDLLALTDWPAIVLDNFRPTSLARWGVDPSVLAQQHGVVWVSLRSEVGEVSFDVLAQARAWLAFAPWMPFYLGDTAAGLFLAFKALATTEPGHYVLGHASCLAKLVEGELQVEVERQRDRTPWDEATYEVRDGLAVVEYRGVTYREPARDRAWQLRHLWHDDGRIRI